MNSCLILDIGNSRLKWAVVSGGRMSRPMTLPHDGRLRPALRRALARAISRCDRACCVSVAAAALTQALLDHLRKQGLPVLRFRSARQQLGLQNGYRETWRLGADRWAAMLGARAAGYRGKSILLVGAGTALTVDLVDSTGRHRGGVIVPGRRLMQSALLADTAGIARRARGPARRAAGLPVFAADTRAALESGADQAAAALVAQLRVEARRKLGHYPAVVLTGGDAPTLARNLTCKFEMVPNLVLRGLAAAL